MSVSCCHHTPLTTSNLNILPCPLGNVRHTWFDELPRLKCHLLKEDVYDHLSETKISFILYPFQ